MRKENCRKKAPCAIEQEKEALELKIIMLEEWVERLLAYIDANGSGPTPDIPSNQYEKTIDDSLVCPACGRTMWKEKEADVYFCPSCHTKKSI